MRHRLLFATASALCVAAVSDISLLPPPNLIDSKFIGSHLLGPSLPPGGVRGHYRDGKGDYQLMLVRMATNEKAAFLLLDVKKSMIEPHYLAHMGGFAGQRDGAPFYVFAKGPFLAAIAGKPEKDADVVARVFAARLPLK